ncbi:MAG: preprotein translocase subunit YajC [Clostridia bacterium]|jgi:preprotein translocase subunit YajC|nr:preprotein translocase subunit YajC [Clostridia bacterium]MDH7572777.1 preprotein translocase subunit YajC [Clostridia bacterium]
MNSSWNVAVLYLVIFFVIMYLFIIRPQQAQQKKRQEMLSRLKVNDHIVTVGGLHGRITRIKEDSLLVRIADKVEVEVDKSAVAYVPTREE